MSSYTNSPEHFASVQAALLQQQEATTWAPKPLVLSHGDNRTGNMCTAEIVDKINTLQRLQATCVTLQYKHHAGNRPRDIVAQVRYYRGKKHTARPLNLHGLFKALSAILYQIEPEHLMPIRPLNEKERAALEWAMNYANRLAVHLVAQTPEYSAAAWDID